MELKTLHLKCYLNAVVVGEENFKKLLDESFTHHIYYHCSRTLDRKCSKHYINEGELENKLLEFIEDLDLSKISISQSLKSSYAEYKKIAGQVLAQQNIDINEDIDIKSYARFIFKEGNSIQKAEFIRGLGIPLYLNNKNIYLEPIKIK